MNPTPQMNSSMREFKVGVSQNKYPKNIIRNQKYTWYGFVFVVLKSQFKLFFNKYFFIVCISQLCSRYAVSPLFSNIMPWAVVIGVTLFREAVDDISRYKRDKKANSVLFTVIKVKKKLKVAKEIGDVGDVSVRNNVIDENIRLLEDSMEPGEFSCISSSKQPIVNKNVSYAKKCSDLCVGDIILLEKDMRVPADCVLLAASGPNVFIRTDQLDGETDWKLRVPVLSGFSGDSILDRDLKICADLPHKDIYSFVGNLVEADCDTYPLNLENTMWMNTILASGRALCCIIYTGTDTRSSMNTLKTNFKIGLIDKELNVYAFFLCALSITAALAFTILRGGSIYRFDATIIRFIVIFSSVIPISLKVSIDLSRYIYRYFIQKDIGCQVRNGTISEDLGRIGYLLTDKTGTLTCNIMKMKKIHMGNISFAAESDDEVSNLLQRYFIENLKCNDGNKQILSPEEPDKFLDHNFNKELHSDGNTTSNQSLLNSTTQRHGVKRKKRDTTKKVFDLLVGLSVCHNVTPTCENGERTYQASSPDEVAIINWTNSIGMKLVHRDSEKIILENITGLQEFKILFNFPFTSESKRMGIIVKNAQGEIDFYMKGADIVMKNIVQTNDWLAEETDNMAREGLRTLIIGKRHLQLSEYNEFCKVYAEASCSMVDRSENIKQAMELLEKDLNILGLTGVEDRLQDDVMVSLENLRNAGISIWMITGDKVETATCIAISSRLFKKTGTYKTIVDQRNPHEARQILINMENDYKENDEKTSYNYLVIDGVSIETYMNSYEKEFINMASKLDALVCCRCSPTQKADLTVGLKKYTNKRVACIGDGGNDVSMITEAHVGIGIVGKEGKQASLAADFSLLKFSDVCVLFLWHGRNSYRATARLAYLIIHRGTIISVMQGIFCALLKFSPFTLYQGIIIVFYVTLYTPLPFFASILSYDVEKHIALRFPELYKELNQNKALSIRSFATWNVVSFYQGALIILLSLNLFQKELSSIISITFSSLIINELLMVIFSVDKITPHIVITSITSLFFYIASFMFLKNELIIPCDFKYFIPKLLFINMAAIIFTIVQMVWNRFIKPSSALKLSNN